jgi:hypothetical protein
MRSGLLKECQSPALTAAAAALQKLAPAPAVRNHLHTINHLRGMHNSTHPPQHYIQISRNFSIFIFCLKLKTYINFTLSSQGLSINTILKISPSNQHPTHVIHPPIIPPPTFHNKINEAAAPIRHRHCCFEKSETRPASIKHLKLFSQQEEYARFAEEVLDRERRSIEKIENKETSAHNAPPGAAVEVPRASTRVYANHSIAFRDCKTCSDLWALWELERPIINKIIQRADAKQAHTLTIQKGRLEAVVRVIERLSEEKGGLQNGIRALEQVLGEFAGKEKSLGGGSGISISAFIEALQGVVNTSDVQKLQSAIKGRSKVTKMDLKKLLDAHWQTTTDWPAVCYDEAGV